jgi:energy-coupling factor transporter ATP-binding protein EcfA2
MAMIEARGLTKRFGSRLAVDALSFDVRPGRVTSFLGPNGSGKSTTMRLIMGLDRPDAGHAAIGGRRYRDLGWPLRGFTTPDWRAARAARRRPPPGGVEATGGALADSTGRRPHPARVGCRIVARRWPRGAGSAARAGYGDVDRQQSDRLRRRRGSSRPQKTDRELPIRRCHDERQRRVANR